MQDGLPQTWIAVMDGKPAGMVRLKADDHPDRIDLSPWLGTLFVHPYYRNKGLGRTLVQTVCGEAREIFGFKSLYLYTPDAENFYMQMGWRKIGMVRDPLGICTEGDTLMQIDL